MDRRLLHIRTKGVWDDAIFQRYAQSYRDAWAAMMRAGGIAYELVDASAFGIQPVEIVEAFRELVHAIPDNGMRRVAVIVPGLVNKIQARQAGELLDARYFRTLEDAVDWLLGTEA